MKSKNDMTLPELLEYEAEQKEIAEMRSRQSKDAMKAVSHKTKMQWQFINDRWVKVLVKL